MIPEYRSIIFFEKSACNFIKYGVSLCLSKDEGVPKFFGMPFLVFKLICSAEISIRGKGEFSYG